MKQTKILMGMHITVDIISPFVTNKDFDEVYTYFKYVDEKFSPYKTTSEVSHINKGLKNYSRQMQEILLLAQQTKLETNGYFDVYHNNHLDPSGIVKGWAIWQASKILKKKGFKNFYIDAGGDVEVCGVNSNGFGWSVGIQNPFNTQEIVKKLSLSNCGVATSGTAIRGQHIYNPHDKTIDDIVSLTVIGPNVMEADRFATAAFAMGKKGIYFIENLSGFEGYMIDRNGLATYTSGFEKYVFKPTQSYKYIL